MSIPGLPRKLRSTRDSRRFIAYAIVGGFGQPARVGHCLYFFAPDPFRPRLLALHVLPVGLTQHFSSLHSIEDTPDSTVVLARYRGCGWLARLPHRWWLFLDP